MRMDEIGTDRARTAAEGAPPAEARGVVAPPPHDPPRFRVIALDCEITAYAPDGDSPLF